MSQTSKKRSSSETVSTLMGEEGIVPDDENALFALYLVYFLNYFCRFLVRRVF